MGLEPFYTQAILSHYHVTSCIRVEDSMAFSAVSFRWNSQECSIVPHIRRTSWVHMGMG